MNATVNPLLKTKVERTAQLWDDDGWDGLMGLTAEDFLDLETLLNEEINQLPLDDTNTMNKLLQLRFMFRILLKYREDLDKGIHILQTYID